MKEVSKYIIQFIKQHFINKKTPTVLSDTSKELISRLYNDIHTAGSHWKTVESDILENSYTYDFPKDPLPKGQQYRYMHKNIRKLIETSDKIGKRYSFEINGQMIHVHLIYPFSEKDPVNKLSLKKQNTYFDNMIHRIYLWLYVSNQMKQNKCSQVLNIYFYLTHLFKLLPDKDAMIDQIHANTAFTTSCSSENEIHVFREEEWFKVFIHETFHSSGIDFSHSGELTEIANHKISEIFPVNIDIGLFETYCELFANNMNILFYIYFKETPLHKVIQEYEKYLYLEQLFSCFQCVKVLHHYDLTFEDLYSLKSLPTQKRTIYKEKTNVLSYYVFKSIYMWNMEFVYQWVLQSNNKSLKFLETKENLHSFIGIISDHYKDDSFLYNIRQMESWFSSTKNKSAHKIENVTLRMTALE